MEQLFYYLKVSWFSVKRAPLPYMLTVLILSLGLGVFFSNATFYYRMNSDPLPAKSDKLFFPMMMLVPYQCSDCKPPSVLSYSNVAKLAASDIPSAQAAMYSADGYLRQHAAQPPTPVNIRITQRDFFTMFDVPLLHGSVWADDQARDELLLSKATAEKLFGRTNVTGQQLLLDDRLFTVIGVLDEWQMLPKLYDAYGRNYLNAAEDIYLPLESGYDYNYLSNRNSSTFDDADYRKLATDGRNKAIHQLQYWVQLDTPAQQQAYRQFMANLVSDEKAAGRHPSAEANQLVMMRDIIRYFGGESGDIKAFAIVTLLFLLVCIFNASHLSLNRYLSNQYEFSLRRALGAKRSQLQLQLLVDMSMMSALTLGGAAIIAYGSIHLMNYLWPSNRLFASWDLQLMLALAALTLVCSYLVTLYPSLRASFGSLNKQLKE